MPGRVPSLISYVNLHCMHGWMLGRHGVCTTHTAGVAACAMKSSWHELLLWHNASVFLYGMSHDMVTTHSVHRF